MAEGTDDLTEDNDESEKKSDNGEITFGVVKVTLLERELWSQFSKLGTEMIITKAGR